MSQIIHQQKRKNKNNSSIKASNDHTQVSSGSKKHSYKSNKRREILPQPNGGIQRIKPKAVYKKREFPKTIFAKKQELLDICPLCKLAIGKETTVMEFEKDLKPAHFECVLKWLESKEELTNNEKISYIGAGKFAIVNNVVAQNNKHKLEIIRHIEFNNDYQGAVPGWRRKLAVTPELFISLESNFK